MYNYDHDCLFEAFVTNLGKYNEGALVGEWVKFPTTHENLQDVFKRIGIDGVRYEKWFITDYDCYVEGIYDVLGEYESLDELNYLASSIEAIDKYDFERFEAAIEYGDYTGSVKDLINLTENLDCYDIIPGVHDEADLGYYYVHDAGIYDLKEMGPLANYINYESFGRDIALDEAGRFTDHGYVTSGRDSFTEYYDGKIENIPEEYKIMSGTSELSEDDRMEMAMDLAFDLDEFFRQKDPQCAAAHPNGHAGKELIADLLLEGKTAAIKDRLAEMAQTPDDELLSRIGGYEQATGYEDYLDTDVAAVRDKLERAKEYDTEITAPDDFTTGEKIETPRGKFSLTALTQEQMASAGYGFHHQSDDGKFYIMANGTRAFAIAAPESYLKNVEVATEDDYGMIDGIINNGKKEVTPPGANEKPSLRDRLAEAKRECAERKPPEMKKPERNGPGHDL